MSATARRMTAPAVDETETTDRLAQALVSERGQSEMSQLLRRRLNNVAEDVERTMFAFAALASGSQLEWENHDPNNPAESLLVVFERAWGIDRARQDDIGGQGPLMRERESSQQMVAELQKAGTFDLLNLPAALAAASDEAIDRAFEDAIAFAGLSETFDDIQAIAGHDVAGLASLTGLGRVLEPIQIALLVRGMLVMRPLMGEGALESIVESAADARPKLHVLAELAQALPQHAPWLHPSAGERLAALPADERDQIIGELRAYLDAHPELAATLDGSVSDSAEPVAAGTAAAA
jgi:hypothetical protein